MHAIIEAAISASFGVLVECGLLIPCRCLSQGRSLDRLDVLMPRLSVASVSMLSYVTISLFITFNFHPFFFCKYVFKTFKTKLHLCIKSVFRYMLNVFCVCVCCFKNLV